MYDNNDYMYAIERNPDYLAHYGIRGMKWGVRKAIQSGNSAKLGRQYAKAQKKLAKLEKRAANAGKYGRRAARMAAGAAVAGGLAAAGTGGISTFMKNNARYAGIASKGIGRTMVKGGQLMSKIPGANKAAGKVIGAGYSLQANNIKNANAVYNAGRAVDAWGRSNSIGKVAGKKLMNATSGNVALNNLSTKLTGVNSVGARRALEKTTNNTIARIGAGAIGAGLAVGAARNAYKAATAKRKAEKFRSAMNESFKGTKYANGGNRQGKKRRR